MKKIDTSITISRPSYGDGKELILIRLRDEASRSNFVEVQLGYKEFTQALTGLSEVECKSVVQNLQNVGKERISEGRTVIYTGDSAQRHNREVLEQWLLDNCQEPGWMVSPYLGSQSSVRYNQKSGETELKYSVYKFVEKFNE